METGTPEPGEDVVFHLTEVMVWVSLSLWLISFAVFAVKRRYDALVMALARWAMNVIASTCFIFHKCALDRKTILDIRGQLQSQWVALGIQLITNQLPPTLQWVQFLVLSIGGILTGSFFSDPASPIGVTVEFVMCMFVIPFNWFYTGQKVDFRAAKYYGPLASVVISYLAYLLTIEDSVRGAITVWQTGFMLTTCLTFVGKAQWERSVERAAAAEREAQELRNQVANVLSNSNLTVINVGDDDSDGSSYSEYEIAGSTPD